MPPCVKDGYVLHLLQMEERNSLLKCFQDWAQYTHVSLNPLPSLDILRKLSKRREIWSSPISDVQEEGNSSSSYTPVPEGHATVGPGGA